MKGPTPHPRERRDSSRRNAEHVLDLIDGDLATCSVRSWYSSLGKVEVCRWGPYFRGKNTRARVYSTHARFTGALASADAGQVVWNLFHSVDSL